MRKKFFSLLVLLAAVVTSAMAQEESLLTTLTFGGSETYGETTSGVVNVTATNVGSYNGTYGWLWDEGGSLSVTAKEGYTITKCVFHQSAKTPITDTEAPFEIHTNDWGGIIEDPYEVMDGVTSIEVYGYANAEPQPAEVTVVFAANSNTVERTVTLPHEFLCSYYNRNGELDAIIQELYGISGGRCCDYIYPVASGNEAVSAGSYGDDNYIAISAAFEGTATVSGRYWNWDAYDGDGDWMDYSLTISIKGDETAVDNIQIDKAQSTKLIRNGMLLIEKNGKIYNALGAEVK